MNKEHSPSRRPFAADIYFQTTEFTCGPACLMMAMAALDPAYKPGRLDELQIWRETNLIHMGEGPAGCGPHGLACAAIKRGFTAQIYESNAKDLFKPWANNEEEAQIQTMLASHDREKARQCGCPISEQALTKDLVTKLIGENKQLITLTSLGLEAHWVIVHDLVGNDVFIIDPYKAAQEELESPYHTDKGHNFIRYADFDEWIKYGPKNSTILLALGRNA